MNIDLVLIRGLPGSGKSTLAHWIASLDATTETLVIEADDYFNVDGEYKFDAAKLGDAHARCRRRTQEALTLGYRVCVANTFTRRSEIKPYYEIADALNKTLTEIICTGNYGSVHGVPLDVIQKMGARFEW